MPAGDRYAVLLRGINVGTRNRVAMTDLRAALEEAGLEDVRTLLASGNAVVRADARPDPAALQAALAARTGVSAPFVVVAAGELAAVIDANPLDPADPRRLLVGFLSHDADAAALAALAGRDWSPEAFATGPGAVYLWCAGGVQRSRVVAAAERAAGGVLTTRNWATTLKLLDLVR